MTAPHKRIKPPLPPPEMDGWLHAISQGASPLVSSEGLVSAVHLGLLSRLGWSLDGVPVRWSRRHWVVTLRGERGLLELHQRSGQIVGGSLILRGQHPLFLDWRATLQSLRWDGRALREDHLEPLGRLIITEAGVMLDPTRTLELTSGEGNP